MIRNMCAQDMPVGFASYFLGNRFILDHNKHLEGVTGGLWRISAVWSDDF